VSESGRCCASGRRSPTRRGTGAGVRAGLIDYAFIVGLYGVALRLMPPDHDADRVGGHRQGSSGDEHQQRERGDRARPHRRQRPRAVHRQRGRGQGGEPQRRQTGRRRLDRLRRRHRPPLHRASTSPSEPSSLAPTGSRKVGTGAQTRLVSVHTTVDTEGNLGAYQGLAIPDSARGAGVHRRRSQRRTAGLVLARRRCCDAPSARVDPQRGPVTRSDVSKRRKRLR
jgi:hypothetical protein